MKINEFDVVKLKNGEEGHYGKAFAIDASL